jgi:hypothetical protein
LSVHSEYSRALESLIACVRALDRPDRERWLERLTNARVDHNPDLSTAARTSLEAVSDLAETDVASPRVADASANLRAHCRMILGGLD